MLAAWMDGWCLCPVGELIINNTEKNSFDHSKKHLYFLALKSLEDYILMY